MAKKQQTQTLAAPRRIDSHGRYHEMTFVTSEVEEEEEPQTQTTEEAPE